MSATYDPLGDRTNIRQSDVSTRLCRYNIAWGTSCALNMGIARRYPPCEIFPLIRCEGAKRVQ